MDDVSKQRTDITTSFEDFERVMEDYFQVIPPDIDSFKLTKTINWKYDDFDNAMIFYFADDWELQSFKDDMTECPALNTFFGFEEYEDVDLNELTITINGKIGGLLG
jgi:hypothetical protein